MIYIISILPALITYIVGNLLIKYPIAISIPTERGMHKNNIASSGGIAILAGIISYVIINQSFMNTEFIALIIITLLGYIDDKITLSRVFRFGSQVLISYLIIHEYTSFGLLETLIGIIFIVYTINIYNFMDGINQLAISQAIFFSIACLIILSGSFLLTLIFISFFLLNSIKTKIFLGSSGSYLLGLIIAIDMISLSKGVFGNIEIFFVMMILMTTFYVDATYTIIVRFLKKISSDTTLLPSMKHVFQTAHRCHAYQKVAIKVNSHTKSVLYMMIYNIVWCLPLAYITFRYNYILLPLMLSYIPYIYYCYINKAGIE